MSVTGIRRIGFDLDDTLDFPAIRDLLLALHRSSGCWVCVISAGKTSLEDKRRQLRYLGVPEDITLHIAEGSGPEEYAVSKANLVEDLGLSMYVEDRRDFCQVIRQRCPSVVVLRALGPKVERSHNVVHGGR